jgi:hypothetical protein
VLSALMLARADDRLQQLKYEAPRSWDHEAKLAFLHLPPDLQRYYVKREKDRDWEVRRCQNELARARQQLKELQSTKEKSNGPDDESCATSA